MEISSVSSEDLVNGREYYAFRLTLNGNYRLSIPLEETQPQKVVAKMIDDGPNYRIYRVDDEGKVTDKCICHSWYIKDAENGITWKNSYDWWVCDSYENALLLREVLINKIINNLNLKIKFLTSLRNR